MTKKQHIVPQFYLKQFSNKEKVFVKDIKHKKEYLALVEDICEENYFYEFLNKYEKKIPFLLNYVENSFAKIENKISPFYVNNLINIRNNNNDVDKELIIFMFVFLC